MRLPLEVTRAIRTVWPDHLPLLMRISATDWTAGGWTPDDSVVLASELVAAGVDLLDCSSGGNVPNAPIPVGPGYQVEFARRVRRDAGIATAAVGLITDATEAESIIARGDADLVFMARELLRNPDPRVRAQWQGKLLREACFMEVWRYLALEWDGLVQRCPDRPLGAIVLRDCL